MQSYEVPNPILNSPFYPPGEYWYIREGESPERRAGRRRSVVFPPRDQRREWDLSEGVLRPSADYPGGYELALVNLIRERLDDWRLQGWPGVTRTSLELLQWWRRDGRDKRLFFAQLEAAETIIFLKEARPDFLQGIAVPTDEPSPQQRENGIRAFARYACKMATGAGKTTVMGMLAAWSILNKVNSRGDARFSDVVLIVCPNVTIRRRLAELDPEAGEGSLYRTRDLVPSHLMPLLRRGKVLVMNWHVFEPQGAQTGGISARVSRAGVPVRTRETVIIGPKTTTARGARYLTKKDLEKQTAAGVLSILDEERDSAGNLKKVRIESVRYVESDTALIHRIMGREAGGKQNILVMNDEAHHAYRIRREEANGEEEEDAEDFFQEATVWIEGLDRLHKLRGINFCVDLSATPYFLGRVGQDMNKPFPWVVSDFGLIDAIEAGLVKIPQLAVQDTTGAEIPGYRNIWQWILPQLTPAERGGKQGNPKPEAILKYAHHPLAMLGGLWESLRQEWACHQDDPRPPVFIIVCKNTRIAKVLYEWLAEDKPPTGIPPAKIEGFLNRESQVNTIRVDSRVVSETDSDESKSDESRWMRLTLDTVGKQEWPKDSQGRSLYPPEFEELAQKLARPLHPPGRDLRCIVSVGMLTEGWDCSTVTHIIGLRPFMSQLLCEQVVGRGLRRASYDLGEDEKFTEEVAKVFGVPFDVIPFKANPDGGGKQQEKRWHVHALSERSAFEIRFPRVEGYTQAVRNRVVVDWQNVPPLPLDPNRIPPEVQMKGLSVNNRGRQTLGGPGRIEEASLREYRAGRRMQELVYDLARTLTREYVTQPSCEAPAHVLFPQMAAIVRCYLDNKVTVHKPADLKDIFLSPYYGWLVEILLENIRPDSAAGETPEIPRYETNRGPGSTSEVDFWTSRDVREVLHSHVNYIVADTKKWEQAAAYYIDTHPTTAAFVKNAGMGFAIPYLHNGQMHDYAPDFIIQLKTETLRYLILETKGFDPLAEIKAAAARRWTSAVNAEGSYGRWVCAVARKPEDIPSQITAAVRDNSES